MKKILSLLALVMLSCMGAWAELGGNLQASTEEVWEHPYFMHNCAGANPSWVRETSGSTGNGTKAGAFAFVKAEGTDNYYIYSIDNQKWLSYEKVNAFADGSGKVILKDEKEHYFKVAYGTCTHGTATTYTQGYTFSPYRTDGAVASRYLNWYNGAGDYTGNTTMGLYSNGFSDAGSVWVLVEPPFTGVNSLQDLSSANWYYVKLKNKYVKYNASASNLQANYDTADGANEAKFVFVGNYKDGYKIYNLAADAAKVLGATNKNTDTAVTMGSDANAQTFKIELYRKYNSGDDYYWQLRETSTTNAFLNYQNSGSHQIIYWAADQGKGDAANQFVFEKVEGAQYHHVAYEYKIGEDQIESESHFVANNAEYPALKSYAFYQYDTPTGNVTESSSNVFSLNWNGPFEEGRYYRLGVRLNTSGALTKYVKFNSSNNQAGCASGNTAFENETLWKFERVSGSAELFRIYNKAAGKYLSTASNSTSVCTADASAANTSYRIYEYTNSTYHNGDNKDFGFVMPDGTDNVLGDHKTNNLGYWNGGTTTYANKMANEGSAFRVVEVPTVDDIQTLIDGTLENAGKVGYPNDMSAINQYATNRVTENNFVEAYNACTTVQSSTDIKLPEDGKMYRFVNIAADASRTQHVLYESASEHKLKWLPTTDVVYTQNQPKGYFVCRKVDDRYMFVNAATGHYLIWRGSDAGNNDNKGYREEYADDCKLTVKHAVYNRTYQGAASSQADLFGWVCIGGTRGSNNSTCFLYSTASTASSDNFIQDSSNDVQRYGDSHSAMFVIEEVENPNKVKLTCPSTTFEGGLNGKYVGTFSAPYNVELPAGVKAYTAEINAEKTVVTFNELGNVVPKNVGVLVYKEDATENVDVVAVPAISTATATNNDFVAVVDGTIAAGKYVLGNGSNGVGFYARVNPTTVANKAYLEVPAGSNLSAFRFDFEDTVTGIEAIENNTNATVFDLQGRRVQGTKSGLYIVNGKKVIK